MPEDDTLQKLAALYEKHKREQAEKAEQERLEREERERFAAEKERKEKEDAERVRKENEEYMAREAERRRIAEEAEERRAKEREEERERDKRERAAERQRALAGEKIEADVKRRAEDAKKLAVLADRERERFEERVARDNALRAAERAEAERVKELLVRDEERRLAGAMRLKELAAAEDVRFCERVRREEDAREAERVNAERVRMLLSADEERRRAGAKRLEEIETDEYVRFCERVRRDEEARAEEKAAREKEREEREETEAITSNQDDANLIHSFSWTVAPRKYFVKALDTTAINSNYSPIPIDLWSYFHAENILPGTEQKLFFNYDNQLFAGSLTRANSNPIRKTPMLYIKWGSGIGNYVRDYVSGISEKYQGVIKFNVTSDRFVYNVELSKIPLENTSEHINLEDAPKKKYAESDESTHLRQEKRRENFEKMKEEWVAELRSGYNENASPKVKNEKAGNPLNKEEEKVPLSIPATIKLDEIWKKLSDKKVEMNINQTVIESHCAIIPKELNSFFSISSINLDAGHFISLSYHGRSHLLRVGCARKGISRIGRLYITKKDLQFFLGDIKLNPGKITFALERVDDIYYNLEIIDNFNSISNDQEQTIIDKHELEPESDEEPVVEIIEGNTPKPVEIDDITKCVLRLHNFFNERTRFTEEEFNKLTLKDGLFVVFEKGEEYYTYDRIVYVGINRVDGSLKDRIKQTFRGNSTSSVLRKYIGAAILEKINPSAIDSWLRKNDSEYDAELNQEIEKKISSYMNQNMSVACVPVPKQIRNKLQKQMVDVLKIEYANTPCAISKNWLGRNFTDSDISSDGVWMKTKDNLLEQDEIDIDLILHFLDKINANEIELEDDGVCDEDTVGEYESELVDDGEEDAVEEEEEEVIELDFDLPPIQLLHQYVNSIERYSADELDSIPEKNGLYVIFEKGEKYCGLDRIVYIGYNSEQDSLVEDIKADFEGSKNFSELRLNLGAAILAHDTPRYAKTWLFDSSSEKAIAKLGADYNSLLEKLNESSVSKYMKKNMSVACIPIPLNMCDIAWRKIVVGLKEEFASKKSYISKNWIGRNFPYVRISKTGVWISGDDIRTGPIDSGYLQYLFNSIIETEVEEAEDEDEDVEVIEEIPSAAEEDEIEEPVVDVLTDPAPAYVPKKEEGAESVESPITETEKPDETKSIDTFESYSWTVVPEKCAIKEIDKSVLSYGETGVPEDVLSFFEAEDLIPGFSRNITLKMNYMEYVASLKKVSRGNSGLVPITKIKWNDRLKVLIDNYCSFAKVPHLVFSKTDDDAYYEIKLIDGKEKYLKEISVVSATPENPPEDVEKPEPKEQHLKETTFTDEFSRIEIPKEFMSFFHANNLAADMNKKVRLNYKGEEFVGIIRKEKDDAPQSSYKYTISWDRRFGRLIDEHLSSLDGKNNPLLVFTKDEDTGQYIISLTHEKGKWEPVEEVAEPDSKPSVSVFTPKQQVPRVSINSIVKDLSLCNEKIVQTLQKHYANGFSTKSFLEIMRFSNYYVQDHNQDCEFENDDLITEIRKVGFEFDNYIYIISKDTFERLQQTIFDLVNVDANIIYYEYLYNVNQGWLNEGHIISEDMMKTIISRLFHGFNYNEKYFLLNSKNVYEKDAVRDDILRVWGEQTLRTFEELGSLLPYISIDKIRTALSIHDIFVWDAPYTYTRSDIFQITDDEIVAIRETAFNGCVKNGSITFDELPIENIKLENFELSEIAIDSIVFSYLWEEFDRNQNVITRKGQKQESREAIKEYCLKHESCTIQELGDVMKSVSGLKNIITILETAYDCMVRITENDFVADDKVIFNVVETDALLDRMINDEAISLKSVTTFALFPPCGFAWNQYLLESYCRRFSRKYRFSYNQANSANIGAIVKVGSTLDYHIVMAKCVASSSVPLQTNSVFDYLYETGFIARRRYNKIDDLIKLAASIREKGH